MYRCDSLPALALAVLLLFGNSSPASAQIVSPTNAAAASLGPRAGHRQFPANAYRGVLVVTQAPAVTVNGQAAQLAPGSRIHGATNLLVFASELTGQSLVVNYTTESSGLVREVWILNAAEAANQPWPSSPQQAATLSFDYATQTWSRP
ncbi:MAG: hypothetical protein JOY60_09285 [Burkholderiaceae bacterium]|nr:hypothetical protein [Roseateles sp.]MBV8470036.1 hypothetical protein [Burkholderiaceae bacterium]